jgi:hypothetical protein
LWLGVGFTESWWAERHTYKVLVWRADQIYSRLLDLFNKAPSGQVVRHLSATCYALAPADHLQQTLYDDDFTRQERIQSALNLVNGRYGAFTIQPASILHIKNPMKKRIPFGSVRYFDEAD